MLLARLGLPLSFCSIVCYGPLRCRATAFGNMLVRVVLAAIAVAPLRADVEIKPHPQRPLTVGHLPLARRWRCGWIGREADRATTAATSVAKFSPIERPMLSPAPVTSATSPQTRLASCRRSGCNHRRQALADDLGRVGDDALDQLRAGWHIVNQAHHPAGTPSASIELALLEHRGRS